jgi:hypothetical protein
MPAAQLYLPESKLSLRLLVMKHNQGSRHPGQALLIRLTSLHVEEAFKKYRDRHKTPHSAIDSAAST